MEQELKYSPTASSIYKDAMKKIEKLEEKINRVPKEKSPQLNLNPPGFKSPNDIGKKHKEVQKLIAEQLALKEELDKELSEILKPRNIEEHNRNKEILHEEYLLSKEPDLTKRQDKFLAKIQAYKNKEFGIAISKEKEPEQVQTIYFAGYLNRKKDFEFETPETEIENDRTIELENDKEIEIPETEIVNDKTIEVESKTEIDIEKE